MRKSTLFISAILTTFMLAVLFGVVSAYQNSLDSTQEAAVQPPPAAMVEVVNALSIPTQVSIITPEEAAAIASKVLNRTDLYSVEFTQLDAVDAYLVTFSSGDIVYVGMDGQILSISKLAVTVITQPNNTGGGNGNNSNSGSGDRHEEDDHEENEHEEDDD